MALGRLEGLGAARERGVRLSVTRFPPPAGIEKEYEQKVLPEGKVSVDGFVCVFDVSQVPNRSLDRMVDLTAAILTNCVRTKRPVVLVTTKNDEANEVGPPPPPPLLPPLGALRA